MGFPTVTRDASFGKIAANAPPVWKVWLDASLWDYGMLSLRVDHYIFEAFLICGGGMRVHGYSISRNVMLELF